MHDLLDHLTLPAGSLLFSEGEVGDVAYLVRSGEIEIFLSRPEGDVVLARRGPGQIIGEMAIIDSLPRSASARVTAACSLVLITASQISRRIAATDPILRMCLGVVIDRYRETVALVRRGPQGCEPAPFHRASEPAFLDAMETLTLERELKRAVQGQEFEVYFQPILDLRTRELAGYEALLRWNHPTRGLLQPGSFIAVAEASGLITQMTEWCLREVARIFPCLMAAAASGASRVRTRDGIPRLFVSVNVSGHDLALADFAETVQAILAVSGMAPENLKLEVTESILMRDPEVAGRVLDACRNGGMGIAIDDFGTGYSSLSYLATLPISTLKIDRAFVRSMVGDPTSAKIVGTILHLARDLGVPVVAEGIEQPEEADLLASLDCEYGQGYLFGRPAALDGALAFARTWAGLRTEATTLALMG